MNELRKQRALQKMTEEVIHRVKQGVSDEELEEIFTRHVQSYENAANPPKNEDEEITECEICCDEFTDENTYIVQPCGHRNCCLGCVKDHVKERIQSGEVNILCPVAGCGAEIISSELFGRLIESKELLDKYSRNTLNLFVSSHTDECKYCPKCSKAMILSDNNPRKVCPACNAVFCVKCGEEKFHDGFTCAEYKEWKRKQGIEKENEDLLRAWLKQNGAICPKCGLGCQRISGCNWIYCDPKVGGCKAGFCYKCEKIVDHFSPHILKADCSLSPIDPQHR